MRNLLVCLTCLFAVACGGDDGGDVCDLDLTFAVGDDGHADPLGASAGQARAGRIGVDDLPEDAAGVLTWKGGDFVIANDRIAMVIEDVGPSDLYDPWGGRPVGFARIDGGQMVEPAHFGEFFVLTGRASVVTTSVSVINDGSDGEAAVIRASGILQPTPFFEAIVGPIFRGEYQDIPTAIEYVLEPDADYVDVYLVHNSPRSVAEEVASLMFGYMYTDRMPPYAPGLGFDVEGKTVDYMAFVDDDATSYAHSRLDGRLGGGIAASGFLANFVDGFVMEACAQTRRHHVRLHIGGPGLDNLRQAIARTNGETLRAISGVVRDANGDAATGVRVHAESDSGDYMTRAMSDENGAYTLHVAEGQAVRLTAYRRGDAVVGPLAVGAAEATADISLEPTGTISVTAVDGDAASLPVRVQVIPTSGDPPEVSGHFGEPRTVSGRLDVQYAMDGTATFTVPVGEWDVVVSRGYEYEIFTETVDVAANQTVDVQAMVEHVVDTTGVMCGDYHIHTHRSADSGDDAALKVMSAVADGLEIPIRSEHEYVEDFQPLVEALGLEQWAFGMASVEMTSMELWGHMGVIPLEPDPTAVNGGTPKWQRFASADDPNAELVTMQPPEVFAEARARPEDPVIIINHPRGSTNYFGYAGYDNVTGLVSNPDAWDEDFSLVEVFNGSGWQSNFGGTVADWLSFLNNGRRVFAVGSSDSHSIRSSMVGYPRTCLQVGTDDPMQLDPDLVTDVTAAGQSSISGGIYVDATVDGVGPGGDATGLGATAQVSIRVQAASWVDVDAIDVVVDGAVVATIPIAPQDADPQNPAIRYDAEYQIDVAGGMGSYVIVAAYGNASLGPVHPGDTPFGVTNPIFLSR